MATPEAQGVAKHEPASGPNGPGSEPNAQLGNQTEETKDGKGEEEKEAGSEGHGETAAGKNDETTNKEKAAGKQDIPHEKLLEWWALTNRGGYGFESFLGTFAEIKKAYEFDWRDKLNTLITEINTELNLRQELYDKYEVSNETDDAKAEGLTAAPSGHKTTGPKPICIPKLNFVPWKELANVEKPSQEHFAIDIPSDEPTPADIISVKATKKRSDRDSNDARDQAPNEAPERDIDNQSAQHPPPEKLPERIRISSLRLQRFLDEDFADGRLSRSSGGPLYLLRPFKMLCYLDTGIRSRIAEFEQARKRLKDLSEDEYQAEFAKDPYPDDEKGKIRDESEMSLSELTGFINDCRCLTKFMDEFLIPEQTRIAAGPETLRFADLWYLFPAGSLVYCKDQNIPQKIWKVMQRAGGRRYISRPESIPQGEFRTAFSPFVLDCYHVDHDGSKFLPTHHQFEIQGFEGTQAIQSLPLLPLHVAERGKMVDRAALLSRGRQFIDCATKACHRYYSGRSHYRTPDGKKLSSLGEGAGTARNISQYSERIDSEVIVDFARAIQEIPWWRPGSSEQNLHHIDIAERGNMTGIDADEDWDRKLTGDMFGKESRKWRLWEERHEAPSADEDLLLLPDRVFAFVLRSRLWACLQLGQNADASERLTEMVARSEPWKDLRLPMGHKEIVQSLINSHFSTDETMNMHFDLVRDKGRGVIILLHGVPGVGKTSTAECAAESNRRPLLPITCGDLGLTPGEVETKLQEIFRLAQAWGCILLLDEADVFLAQRTANDIQRNALVSVFLRTLEYYEGILFLTTNRVGVFDEAFKSRIHISLYYPTLDQSQTYQIWQTHITKATEAGMQVDQDELLAFAGRIYEMQKDPRSGPVWNGRQIRNAFQSALALAGFHTRRGEPVKLGVQYFQSVFEVSDKFSNYIWRVRQSYTDADWNRMGMVRRDDFEYVPTTVAMMDNSNFAAQPQPARIVQFPQSTFGQAPQQASPNVFGTMPGQYPAGGNFGGFSSPYQANGLATSPAASSRPFQQFSQNPSPLQFSQQTAQPQSSFQGALYPTTPTFPGQTQINAQFGQNTSSPQQQQQQQQQQPPPSPSPGQSMTPQMPSQPSNPVLPQSMGQPAGVAYGPQQSFSMAA